jgi:hypothetical protein
VHEPSCPLFLFVVKNNFSLLQVGKYKCASLGRAHKKYVERERERVPHIGIHISTHLNLHTLFKLTCIKMENCEDYCHLRFNVVFSNLPWKSVRNVNARVTKWEYLIFWYMEKLRAKSSGLPLIHFHYYLKLTYFAY